MIALHPHLVGTIRRDTYISMYDYYIIYMQDTYMHDHVEEG